jgi:hypothetical protein
MLRESLGHSRLEMPADQDPHYMTPTLFKAAHSLTAASAQFPRPTQTAMTERTELTKTALQVIVPRLRPVCAVWCGPVYAA